MTQEERDDIKRAEKERLLARKRMQQQEKPSALQSLEGMLDRLESPDDVLEQLEAETARKEARVEMAMEAARQKERAEPTPEEKARALVEQLKLQMGMAASTDTDTTPPLDGPEKTIGRMRRSS